MISRQALKNGIEAAFVLAVVMGFGRFAYTALYPYMVSERILSIEQGSLAASANYVGYLIGALMAVRIKPSKAHQMAFVALLGTAIGLAALYFVQSSFGIIFVRLLAGVLSALGIVSTSMWLLGQRHLPQAAPMMYAGVGLGIALSAESVVWAVGQGWCSPMMWLMLGAVAVLVMMSVLHGLFFDRRFGQADQAAAQQPDTPISANALIGVYGLAGFGYIVTATYLPLLVQMALPKANIGHIWAAFGLSVIPSCFIWYLLRQRLGSRASLTLNMAMQALGVTLPLILPNTWGYVLSAVLVGGGFMGTVTLVMPIAQQLAKDSGKNLIAIVTVSYSAGQIIGPLISAKLYQWTHDFQASLVLAACALSLGALIAWKNG
ncbi:YbfB/YjiJ family MFS transporter [Moraxella canis]|uniref:YbfB/YjiJ family MFS transporter n=1 Tax=Moraxella canis TaxID=90239 RepID=A0ABZ0WYW0_9GAMM|nr:YbfB/YjiJ family MFS transporter [Moraxella canis]WQE04285.1 YbfB/YjiJ family MFS transporter [Moraxella canis]